MKPILWSMLAAGLLIGLAVSGCDRQPATSLFEAASAGQLDQLDLHFKAGTDVNARDENGDTPLVLAARGGHVKAVGRLIEHGADVNAKAADGTTPMAASTGHPQVAALLAENGAKDDPMALIDGTLKSFDVMFALLAEYPDDCDKAMGALEDYLDENGARLQDTFSRLQAMEADLTPEQKQEFAQRMNERAQSIAQKAVKVMTQFGQKCPDHMARFAMAIQKLTPTPKPAERPLGVAE